jgi:hypothetical protein
MNNYGDQDEWFRFSMKMKIIEDEWQRFSMKIIEEEDYWRLLKMNDDDFP